ncbi:MAG: ribonuclease III [Clostridia bacterium]|nr:ribonuclease III [Clostridia bacterium]
MNDKRINELEGLTAKLKYRFTDPVLLNTALTHSSYVKGENRASVHNERMEFLGDAVLELCVSEYLYLNYPKMNEGMMTRTRSKAVYEQALYSAAKELELGKYLRLSRGEEHTGGRDKPSILSDALEAVIGAMFLDGGLECAKAFILGFVKRSIDDAVRSVTVKDYKTLLQEYVQQRHSGELTYTVIGINGPDHKRVFTMQVSIDGVVYGFGNGSTKQEAGQNAAKATLELLNRLTDINGKKNEVN